MTLLLLFSAVPAGAAEARLRCKWTSPTDRAELDMVFVGNPLLVVLPGAALSVAAESDGGGPGRVTILRDGEPYREDAALQFTAPDEPGAYFIPVNVTAADAAREAEICVLVPFKATGRRDGAGLTLSAGGQEIGHYRDTSRSGNRKVRANPASYSPPVWWLRLTDMNAGFEIVPGVTAAELVTPSEDTGLRHADLVPVNYPMWQAIVTLRRELAARGVAGDLRIISVFRSPAYNRGVGSNAFGRHIYGDAFDFYIGSDQTGRAADINHDGRLDRRDAYPVISIIEDLQADGSIPAGGVGVYNHVAGDHVVTMHLDMRGHRATWGYRYAASGRRGEFSWQSRRFADIDRQDEDAAAAAAAREGRKYARPRREALQ